MQDSTKKEEQKRLRTVGAIASSLGGGTAEVLYDWGERSRSAFENFGALSFYIGGALLVAILLFYGIVKPIILAASKKVDTDTRIGRLTKGFILCVIVETFFAIRDGGYGTPQYANIQFFLQVIGAIVLGYVSLIFHRAWKERRGQN